MANCSIPSLNPAIGRISTRSLGRSKRGSRTAARYQPLNSTKAIAPWSLGSFNVQRSTLNAQRSIQRVEGCMLDVGRWTFSVSRRVKGAWWPSRSSKPSSSRLAGGGRFDSYPLRQIFSRHPERSAAKLKDPVAISKSASSGFLDFARNDKLIEGGEPTCRVSRFVN
jgi:hypothetical protein